MANIGTATYVATYSGSVTVNPGGGAVVAGTVLAIRLHNHGPAVVYVTANTAGAADTHNDSSPRDTVGFPVQPGAELYVRTSSLNIDVPNNPNAITARVAVIAEV